MGDMRWGGLKQEIRVGVLKSVASLVKTGLGHFMFSSCFRRLMKSSHLLLVLSPFDREEVVSGESGDIEPEIPDGALFDIPAWVSCILKLDF